MLPFRRDVTRHVTDFTSPATSTGGTCWSTCCPGSLRRAPCSGSRGLIWKWKKRKGHHFKICFDPISALKMISLSPSRPDFLCFSHMISGCSLATSVGYKRSVWWIFLKKKKVFATKRMWQKSGLVGQTVVTVRAGLHGVWGQNTHLSLTVHSVVGNAVLSHNINIFRPFSSSCTPVQPCTIN